MKLLLVEDEPNTANYLKRGLNEAGFNVDHANNGIDALSHARTIEYDVMILDMQLPGKSGWEVLEQLRGDGNRLPVLCLTAQDAVHQRVRGLELGADDYLVKPFAYSELLARIRTLIRRNSDRPSERVRIADLEIDLVRYRAQRGEQVLDLRPKEFALLSLLARRNGEVLTRTMIVEQIWDANFDFETNVVDVHIKRLRETVDEPFDKKLIHTVRGVGYVLEERT